MLKGYGKTEMTKELARRTGYTREAIKVVLTEQQKLINEKIIEGTAVLINGDIRLSPIEKESRRRWDNINKRFYESGPYVTLSAKFSKKIKSEATQRYRDELSVLQSESET